jgi:1-acyl-sn-glycerol-3-phosphate acyltransferase
MTTNDAAQKTSIRSTRHWGPLARLVAMVLRCAVHIFFREIEIVGAEKLPRGVPLVLVANHVNGIVDPLLVGLLRLRARFLAKSTLWKNPVIRPLLSLTGAIPVYRRQDPGADASRNTDSFERCHAALAQGDVIALFPEGKSHSEAALAPLKTGAARIVLETAAKHPSLGIRVVPVGLSFDAKALFRSRAVVRVGEPIDPAAERGVYGMDEWAAVRRLTGRIAAALEAVTVNYPSWDEGRLIERAVDVYAHAELELPTALPLAERCALYAEFAGGYRDLIARQPERLQRMTQSVRRYDSLLSSLRLRDEQVVARYPVRLVGRFVWRSVAFLAVWLPLAFAGTILNWLPYRFIGIAARRFAPEQDVAATYKLLGGVLIFPLWWALCAAVAGWQFGAVAGFCAAPAAAVCGYLAMLFHERRAQLWDEARAYVLLGSRRALATELTRRRAAVSTELRDLITAYRIAPPETAGEPPAVPAAGRPSAGPRFSLEESRRHAG